MYGPEAGAGLDLAKLHDQLHKHTFKMLSTRANGCQGRNLWAALKQARRKKRQKKKKKHARKNIRTSSNNVHTAFVYSWLEISVNQWSYQTRVVLHRDPKQQDKQLSPRGGSFYHRRIMGSNHNHPQTIWPTWSCCYTIAHCAGYDSDFMFMLWV